MNWRATMLRVIGVAIVLALVLRYIWRSQLDSGHSTLLLTMVSVGLTAVYVVLTFEIVLQNQKMTRATFESAGVMERSLRLSYSPNMAFATHITRNPKLGDLGYPCVAHRNEDYERALREQPDAGQAMEFVFAIIRNVGRGTATKVQLTTAYEVQEQANPNFTYKVTKRANIPLLEPNQALALTIHICRSPSAGDGIKLESADVSFGDFYRDALGEATLNQQFAAANSYVAKSENCTLVLRQ